MGAQVDTITEITLPDGRCIEVVRKQPDKPKTVLGWIDENLHCKLWSKQREIIQALDEYSKVAVSTCNKCGKTFVSGQLIPAWLQTYTPSLVVTTAPSHHQVKTLLWKEARAAWHCMSEDLQARGQCLDLSIKMFYEGTRTPNPKHGAHGRATNKPGLFQGQHNPNMLIVVDEAGEVSDDMFGIIDTFGAERELLIGNPIHNSGKFYHAFHNPELGYHCITISCEDTPNFTGEADALGMRHQFITPEMVKQWEAYWGKDSTWIRSHAYAQFPTEDAEDVLIPEDWFKIAQKRESPVGLHPEVQLGVDVAHFGSDAMCIATRADRSLVDLRSYSGRTSTQDVCAHVRAAVARAALTFQPRCIIVLIDRTGVGAGVSDILTAESGKGVTYVGKAFGESPRDILRFANLRAEIYWTLRECFQPGGPGDIISVKLDPQASRRLMGQVSGIHYAYNDRGKVQIESKEMMRQRGLPSPDEADATALAFAPYAIPIQVYDQKIIKPTMPSVNERRRGIPVGW